MVDAAGIAASLFFAALLGFAAHRASICSVRAVAELLSTRRGFMLVGFAKTVFWVIATTLALIWIAPLPGGAAAAWAVTPTALLGGFIFGLGATVNSGCAFSTLAYLSEGKLVMALVLVAFALGVGGGLLLIDDAALPAPMTTTSAFDTGAVWMRALSAALLIWILWEVWRLWRSRPAAWSLGRLILAERYRLSTAAALMGVANGFLFAWHGPWAYTSVMTREARSLAGLGAGAAGLLWALGAALTAGMLLSAWQRGRFRLDARPRWSWLRHILGGGMMGLGAALVPGGNDVLLLHAIPGLSPHALPAFGSMLLGIGLALAIHRWVTGQAILVDCSGDICVVGEGQPGKKL